MSASSASAHWRTPAVVLLSGGLILTLSMGIRHGFGLFLQPMSAELHWGREVFALAIAVQNLAWGATQPFVGMLADKYGTAKGRAALRAAEPRWGKAQAKVTKQIGAQRLRALIELLGELEALHPAPDARRLS